MAQPWVWVVILNWNLYDDTAECITSVLGSDYPNYHILVIDNGSSDGSPEYLRQHFPGVEIIVNPENWGFARGNNVGIRRALDAGADYLFLLNNDAVVDASTLGQLVAIAETAANVGMVAPKALYYAEKDRIWHLGGRAHRWLPVPTTVGRNEKDDGRFRQPFDVDYVAFCGVLLKRTLLETVGLLDERFVFTYEDSDLCCRARQVGFRILSQPQARLWHKVSVSARKNSANVAYVKSKSRAMFYRLHPHGPHVWLTAAYLWTSTLGTAALSLLRGDADLARSILRGLYDGYRVKLEVS